jgi:hypothetical protein
VMLCLLELRIEVLVACWCRWGSVLLVEWTNGTVWRISCSRVACLRGEMRRWALGCGVVAQNLLQSLCSV